jgi:hypothetical protein
MMVLPLGPIGFSLLMEDVFTGEVNSSTGTAPVVLKVDLATVMSRLDNWAAANGYQIGEDSTWLLNPIPSGDPLAKVELRHLWQPSVFDRWQRTFSGLKRKTPDLALEIVGSTRSKETSVSIFARHRSGPGLDQANQIVSNLLSALNQE